MNEVPTDAPSPAPRAVRTRVASLEDAAELARLNAAFNDVHEPPEKLAERLGKPGCVEIAILAEVEGKAVGFAGLRLVPCLFADAIMAELTELYVDPSYRRRGVGLALVRHAERLAQQAGARELCLATGFDNQIGQAFYRTAGYRDADLFMSKPLAPAAHESRPESTSESFERDERGEHVENQRHLNGGPGLSDHEYHRDSYSISTDRARLDVAMVHEYLSQRSYWAQGRSLETVRTAVENSLCFGVYDGSRQVGFARLVTDYATFAWLCDVFILESHRGRGLGKWMIECVAAHPDMQGKRLVILATRDAHELYRRYGGFQPLDAPERWMVRRTP